MDEKQCVTKDGVKIDIQSNIDTMQDLEHLDEFNVKNGIERIKSNASEMDLREQIIEIHLSTLTMVKSKIKVPA